PWLLGNPQPTGPTEYGVAAFVSVYHFTFNMSPSAGSGTTIVAAGSGGPILQWTPLTSQPPDAGQPNGFVNFLGISPTPILRPYTNATLTLTRVPGPGGAGLLLAWGTVAARRRRR